MEARRLLYLCDPLSADSALRAERMRSKYPNLLTIHFSENERWLHRAQRGFSEEKNAILAAEGTACVLALAVAVQLPVEILLLHRCNALERSGKRELPIQLRRTSSFVRRNLSLIVSNIYLSDTVESEMIRLSKGVSHYAQIEIIPEKCAESDWFGAFLHRS